MKNIIELREILEEIYNAGNNYGIKDKKIVEEYIDRKLKEIEE